MLILQEKTDSAVLAFAAQELKAYLNRMISGFMDTPGTIRLEIREKQGNDWFRIAITGQGGSIAGNSERAVLLGVYRCLHCLGCRFLGPGHDCERIPSLTISDLEVTDEEQASYRHRGVCIEGAESLENVMDFIDWLPKVGYNSFFLQFKTPYTFLARWYHHRNNPYAQAEAYTEEDAEGHKKLLEGELQKRGLLIHQVGHGWTGETLGYQALDWNTETKPLDESRYPWTALVDGQRGLYGGIPVNTNLCCSNEEAMTAFVKLVVEYASANPQVDCLHIWLADSFNNICECEACQSTTPSDQYICLLNRIDEELSARELKTRLVFLLYQELLWPPEREKLKNPDRFVLMFAPISRTFEASYEPEAVYGSEKAEIPLYRRNQISLPVDLRENMAFLKAWQRCFEGDSFVYDYPMGRAHYGDFGYVHIARIIAEDIRKLRQMGLHGYISCQELRAGLPNWLPGYVMGRMLWNDRQSFEELRDEYFAAAYGPEYEKVEEYLENLSSLSSCDYINGKGKRRRPDLAKRMEKICQCCESFETEQETVRREGEKGSASERNQEADSVQDLFWHLLAYHREYVLRLAPAVGYLADGQVEAARKSWQEFREFVCRNEPEYQRFLDVYRVLDVTGNYTGLC